MQGALFSNDNCNMPNGEQAVEECDATTAASYSVARYIKKLFLSCMQILL